jgi:putative transposase
MIATKELSASVGVRASCMALGVARSSFYHHHAVASGCRSAVGVRPVGVPKQSRPTPKRALSQQQEQEVLAVLNSERFVDCSPAAIYATLLDEGRHLCSERTYYRILAKHQQLRERRQQRQHPEYAAPELLATRINAVWSWDITKLKGAVTGTSYHLYVILDLFSRYVTGWMLAQHESDELARQLIEETALRQGITTGQLTIHADRGPSMRSKSVALLLSDLGITKSHSRPYCSNDNPYSESQFKTMKYRPEFPRRFCSIEEARAFCGEFFRWYNHEHYHSGIALLTPHIVHSLQSDAVIAKRDAVLRLAYQKHPERFVHGLPTAPRLPEAVWINKPEQNGVESGKLSLI